MKKNTAPLAKARLAAGFKQAQAASKAGVSTLHLLRVERGSEALSEELRRKLSKVLRISEDLVQRKHDEARKAWAEGLREKS